LNDSAHSPYTGFSRRGPAGSVTTAENQFFDQVATGDTAGTPAFEGAAMVLVDTGLVFTGSRPTSLVRA
jgi:hypothetical protein